MVDSRINIDANTIGSKSNTDKLKTGIRISDYLIEYRRLIDRLIDQGDEIMVTTFYKDPTNDYDDDDDDEKFDEGDVSENGDVIDKERNETSDSDDDSSERSTLESDDGSSSSKRTSSSPDRRFIAKRYEHRAKPTSYRLSYVDHYETNDNSTKKRRRESDFAEYRTYVDNPTTDALRSTHTYMDRYQTTKIQKTESTQNVSFSKKMTKKTIDQNKTLGRFGTVDSTKQNDSVSAGRDSRKSADFRNQHSTSGEKTTPDARRPARSRMDRYVATQPEPRVPCDRFRARSYRNVARAASSIHYDSGRPKSRTNRLECDGEVPTERFVAESAAVSSKILERRRKFGTELNINDDGSDSNVNVTTSKRRIARL